MSVHLNACLCSPLACSACGSHKMVSGPWDWSYRWLGAALLVGARNWIRVFWWHSQCTFFFFLKSRILLLALQFNYNTSPFSFLSPNPPIYPSKNSKFMTSFFTKYHCICAYTYVYIYTHKILNITHSFCLMLPVCMFSGLSIGVCFPGKANSLLPVFLGWNNSTLLYINSTSVSNTYNKMTKTYGIRVWALSIIF